ncbi:type II CRISPR-associated endonuclease Cas1 [Desulfocurvus vexinensis]|uniref:type II CRISPR-associated endonuclease Cas1 n=1 Tax=Desulfocurvus vexinensis TaxID=399548 RepID=UPI00048FFB1D|nr:type II CRISPR-associated endonuclease Cas1 [Desulfocurvus vexinensis]
MIPRTVEVSGDSRHLCKELGFLAVYCKKELLGRIPLDDLGLVLACGHGLTYSNGLLVALAERGVPLVVCDQGLRPAAVFWPLQAHGEQGRRMQAQANATAPLKKRLWQQLVACKIRMQAAAARRVGAAHGHLEALSRSVASGDSTNREAAAAKVYWRLCFGPSFRRDRDTPGTNALLNYAYGVVRGATARAVMLAGLHPSFSLHHSALRNPLALVDDLMEPYRPLADLLVLELGRKQPEELNPESKRALAQITIADVRVGKGISTVGESLKECAASLADVLMGQRKTLALPRGLTGPDAP